VGSSQRHRSSKRRTEQACHVEGSKKMFERACEGGSTGQCARQKYFTRNQGAKEDGTIVCVLEGKNKQNETGKEKPKAPCHRGHNRRRATEDRRPESCGGEGTSIEEALIEKEGTKLRKKRRKLRENAPSGRERKKKGSIKGEKQSKYKYFFTVRSTVSNKEKGMDPRKRRRRRSVGSNCCQVWGNKSWTTFPLENSEKKAEDSQTLGGGAHARPLIKTK